MNNFKKSLQSQSGATDLIKQFNMAQLNQSGTEKPIEVIQGCIIKSNWGRTKLVNQFKMA